jgi:DUF4097 and DUF4098 domain-containing protein YvlB
MNQRTRLVWVLLAFVFLPAIAAWGLQDTKDFHWNGKLAADQTITVKTINGDIQAEPSSGGEVEVTAQASGTYAQQVNFQVKQDSDGVTICETYPHHDSCSGSSNNKGNDHTRISYKVRVPAANRFSGHSVNGGITARNLDRQVKATTVNGTVKVSTKSWVEASSVNGSVEAMMGSAGWNGSLHISSVNGSLHVGLPADANVDIEMNSVNGGFQSELPITAKSLMSRHMQGRLGSGGRELKLNTVNGSVRLVKTGNSREL